MGLRSLQCLRFCYFFCFYLLSLFLLLPVVVQLLVFSAFLRVVSHKNGGNSVSSM